MDWLGIYQPEDELPSPLRRAIWVIGHMASGTPFRDAVASVAIRDKVTEAAVRYACTRALGLTTEEFEHTVESKRRIHAVLRQAYPQHVKLRAGTPVRAQSDEINISELPRLQVGCTWTCVRVTGGLEVRLTRLGYAPLIPIVDEGTERRYVLYIGARSIAEPLEQLRKRNGGKFEELRFMVRKLGPEKTAKYDMRPS